MDASQIINPFVSHAFDLQVHFTQFQKLKAVPPLHRRCPAHVKRFPQGAEGHQGMVISGWLQRYLRLRASPLLGGASLSIGTFFSFSWEICILD